MGADVIILEEAAQMKQEYIKKTVLPVLQVGHTNLIAISTRTGEENFFSKLLNSIDTSTGLPTFATFNFFGACDACIKDGEADRCEHLAHEMPHWLHGGKRRLVIRIMESMGEGGVDNEMLGISSAATCNAFDKVTVRDIFDPARAYKIDMLNQPSHIFFSIDPSGGSEKTSEMALITGFYTNDRTFVILGVESVPATSVEVFTNIVSKHMKIIRSIYDTSKFLLILECNMRVVGAEIIRRVNLDVGTFSVMTRNGVHLSNIDYGDGNASDLRTTNEVKRLMYNTTDIAMRGRRVVFSNKVVSVYSRKKKHLTRHFVVGGTSSAPRRETMNMLRGQLIDYMKTVTNPPPEKRHNTPVKVTFSGKNTGLDDLAISLQLALHWGAIFYARGGYYGC